MWVQLGWDLAIWGDWMGREGGRGLPWMREWGFSRVDAVVVVVVVVADGGGRGGEMR